MSDGTIGGARVMHAIVQESARGIPFADIELDAPVELAGAQTLTIAGASWRGMIISGGPYEGRARYRLQGGAGGWGCALPAKAYTDDRGVAHAKVLSEAATAAGETIADVPTTRAGPNFVRVADEPASWALNELYPGGWYVDRDGVTRIGARTAATYSGTATRVRVDKARGVLELALDSLDGVAPGVTVDWLTATRLVARLYGSAGVDQFTDALAGMVAALFPDMRYRGKYEYRVVSQSAERLNLQPVRRATGMPDLLRVPVRLAPGIKYLWKPGSLCAVEFLDGDPSRAIVTAGDAPDSPGWLPLPAGFILAGPVPLPAARVTDAVQAGPFAGVITGPGSTLVSIG
jgi:hypothetical protein